MIQWTCASTWDPETDQPHIYNHGVTETEVEGALRRPGEDRAGDEGSRVAIGHTAAGRCLKVIYSRDAGGDSAFVITAYELTGKPSKAYGRRQESKMKNQAKKSKPQQFPPGWDETRVRKVLAHYENQSEDEAVAEDEGAFATEGQTVMIVPSELVPKIRNLIARARSD